MSFTPVPFHRRFLCGLAQLLVLPFVMALHLVQWLVLVLSAWYFLGTSGDFYSNFFLAVPVTFAAYTATVICVTILVIILKWIIIGRTKPGRYPLWGVYYYRVWLVKRLLEAAAVSRLRRSPLYVWYLRSLGATIGRDVFISGFRVLEVVDLLIIGDGAVLGEDLAVSNAEAIGNEFVIGIVSIGSYANIGTSCVLCCNTYVGYKCKLLDLTCIHDNVNLQPLEEWEGSPGRKVDFVSDDSMIPPIQLSEFSRALYYIQYIVGYFICSIIDLFPLFLAYAIIDAVSSGNTYDIAKLTSVLVLWPIALLFSIVALLQSVIIRWIVLPFRLKAGTCSIYSFLYFRMWLVTHAAESSLEMVHTVIATLYMPVWYKLMGMRVGSMSEFSANVRGNFDMITFGDDCFVGDEAIVGQEDIIDGWATFSNVDIGNKVFIGNGGKYVYYIM